MGDETSSWYSRGALEPAKADRALGLVERRKQALDLLGPYRPSTRSREVILDTPDFHALIRLEDGVTAPAGVSFDSALESYGMDSVNLKQAFTLGQGAIPDDLFDWYTRQSFIGYQACALISQNWLVNKALMIPAKDAVRNGFLLGTIDGEELDLDTRAEIWQADKDFGLPQQLIRFALNVRRFGIRIAIFNVESSDEKYYEKPFNIDGVKPGSYKGISQVDPNWTAPILDEQAAANPAAMDFYEPTYWLIAGKLYHKSHLIISRYVEPPDVLKPSYQYGGIPLTQLILERVYDAERTATEAPMLVQTKRLNIIYTDVAAVTANPGGFQARLDELISYRNNYGVYVADLEDRLEQQETALNDLDVVIMTEYQLVAAVAEIPATKLMGTSPKGFNATGEFEMKAYHDLLENIQTDLTPLIDRHHELVIRSLELGDVDIEVVWNPVSSPDAKEQAEINQIKSTTDNALMLSGGIDANDIRNRVIADPNSGYTGIQSFENMEEIDDEDLDFGELDGPGGTAAGAKAPPENGDNGTTPPKPELVETEPEEPEPEESSTIQELSLNGAQISSLVELVAQVTRGELPRETAEEIVLLSFPVNAGDVDRLFSAVKEGSLSPVEEPEDDDDEKSSAQDYGDSNVLGYVRITPSPETGAKLHIWATRAGIVGATRPTEFHATLMWSRVGIPEYEADSSEYTLKPFGVGLLGPPEKPALVVFVESPKLRARAVALEKMGAISDYPEFLPHFTLKYDPVPGDLALAIAAFKKNPIGKLVMGTEIRQVL